jgi:hypothetical protein
MQGIRLASGLLLLPLLVRLLPTNDLGMYYVFLSVSALSNLVDFGFSHTIGRAIAYAYGGARELKAQGLALIGPADAQPNLGLVWDLLVRVLLRYLSIATGFLEAKSLRSTWFRLRFSRSS